MGRGRDWLPAKREGQLTMAKCWVAVLQVKAAAWEVPAAVGAELLELITTADDILALAMSSQRNQVITAQCRAAFDALATKMRFVKNRYFLSPPLTAVDFAALGLDEPDLVHTRREPPKAQMTAEIGRSGTAMLILRLMYAEGTESLANPHTDIEYQIRWAKYSPAHPVSNPAAGEVAEVPSLAEELPVVFTTKRRRELIAFETGDSGKVAYVAIRIGNGNKEYGRWCTMISAVIP